MAARPDILVSNELPFGPWIAENAAFSEDDARLTVSVHNRGLDGLADLNIPAVISSSPVRNGDRLANEAFVLESGSVRPLHRKQYFPNEAGWYESRWYAGDGSGFHATEILGIIIGVLLCTDAMFNEHARAYGKQGASLIVIPRASGLDLDSWKVAGAMASLVSGAYVVSSNRVGIGKGGTQFGGGGYAYAPHGRLIAMTDPDHPVQILELDPEIATAARLEYPCYVGERK
jgi:N-carbamoylputrescine amidase